MVNIENRQLSRPAKLKVASMLTALLSLLALFVLPPESGSLLAGLDRVSWLAGIWTLLILTSTFALHPCLGLLRPAPVQPGNHEPSIKIGALILIVLWGAHVCLVSTASIGGERYWWLFDDMMISMQYARNLAEGYGLVWNQGEPVEGYSNLLWVLIMTPVHWLGLPDRLTSLPIILVSLAFAAASLWPLTRLVRQLGGSSSAVWAGMALLICNNTVLLHGNGGCEHVLVMYLVLLISSRLIDELPRNELFPFTYVLIGLLPLVRLDAALLSLVFGLLALAHSRRRVAVFLALAIAMLPSLFAEIFRYWYYGDWLPNTAYLKTGQDDWSLRLKINLLYIKEFFVNTGPIWLMAIPAFLMRQRWNWTLAWTVGSTIVAAQFFYAAYIGRDGVGNLRFMVPFLPVLIAMSVVLLETAIKNNGIRLLTIAIAIAWTSGARYLWNVSENLIQVMAPDNILIARHLRHETPADAKVAEAFAGITFYFARRQGVDVLGKMDPDIARGPVSHPGGLVGHNKFNFDHSLGYHQPDYVVALWRQDADMQAFAKDTGGRWRFPGYLWRNTLFRNHCLPNPMPWNTGRQVYRCEWAGMQRLPPQRT